jgi:hypothetical protein
MNFGTRPEAHNNHVDYIAASGCLQGRIFAADSCYMPLVQNRLSCLPALLARTKVLLPQMQVGVGPR